MLLKVKNGLKLWKCMLVERRFELVGKDTKLNDCFQAFVKLLSNKKNVNYNLRMCACILSLG